MTTAIETLAWWEAHGELAAYGVWEDGEEGAYPGPLSPPEVATLLGRVADAAELPETVTFTPERLEAFGRGYRSAYESARDSAAERAYERQCERFYGGSAIFTDEERRRAALKLK